MLTVVFCRLILSSLSLLLLLSFVGCTNLSFSDYFAGVGVKINVPANFTAVSADARVQLTWNTTQEGMRYDLYWSVIPGLYNRGDKIANITSPFNHTGLKNNRPHYYSMVARNDFTVSLLTDEILAIPTKTPSPTGLIATPGNDKVILTWNVESGSTYDLYWSTTPGEGINGNQIADVTSPYTHTGLTNGTDYYYVLTATNHFGTSFPTQEQSATPMQTPPPTGLIATPGNAQVTLTWDVESGSTYDLYWSTTPGGGTNGNQITDVTAPYTHTGLTNGTDYYYVLTATNHFGTSFPTQEQSATPMQTPPPTGLMATIGNAQVTLTWDVESGSTYDLYWSTTPGGGTNGNQITDVTAPYTHTGLTNGITYYYSLTASTPDFGTSSPTQEQSATPMQTPPPTGLIATPGNAQVTLTWDVESGSTYDLYWSTTPGGGTNRNQITDVTAPYTHTGLTNGITYYYSLTASTPDFGTSSPTQEQSATLMQTPPPTGLVATIGNAQVTLTWNVESRSTYDLYWSTTPGGGTSGNQITDVTAPYTHTGLTNGITYYYSLTASTPDFGTSSPTQEQSAIPKVDSDGDGLIEIWTATMLDDMRYDLAGTSYKTSVQGGGDASGCPAGGCSGYELMANIDLLDLLDANNNDVIDMTTETVAGKDHMVIDVNKDESWSPVGGDAIKFTGTFEGNGHTIANLWVNISTSGDVYAGLFGVTGGSAEIRNVGVISGGVSSSSHSGGLVGRSFSSLTITNSYFSGSGGVSSSAYSGGLVGRSSSSLTITNSYFSGSGGVSASSSAATESSSGGLVGSSGSGSLTITNSYFSGSGGVVSDSGSDSASYSYSGGLVGVSSSSSLTITNSYFSGSGGVVSDSVSDSASYSYSGGLVGVSSSSSFTITNSYFSGSGGVVSDSYSSYSSSVTYSGGLVGRVSSSSSLTITNSYWNTDAPQSTDGWLQSPKRARGDVTVDPMGAVGLTLAELKATGGTFPDLGDAWDLGTTTQLPAVKRCTLNTAMTDCASPATYGNLLAGQRP